MTRASSCSRAAIRSRPHVRERLPEADVVVAADSGVHLADASGPACRLHRRRSRLGRSRGRRGRGRARRRRRAPSGREGRDRSRARARRGRGTRGRADRGRRRRGRPARPLARQRRAARAPRFADVRIEALMGDARIIGRARRAPRRRGIDGAPGRLVTLLPVGGDALGVTTTGSAVPARAAKTLRAGTTRGVSNELVDIPPSVGLDEGALLVVQPSEVPDETADARSRARARGWRCSRRRSLGVQRHRSNGRTTVTSAHPQLVRGVEARCSPTSPSRPATR